MTTTKEVAQRILLESSLQELNFDEVKQVARAFLILKHTPTGETWICNKCGYSGNRGPEHVGCNYSALKVPQEGSNGSK